MAETLKESLLAAVTLEDPCGADLQFQPPFDDLVARATRKPERQMGESVIPAEEPKWRDVQGQAAAFLSEKSKDLRIANLLVRACLHNEGFAGLALGLSVVRGLVERYWDKIHPRPDPEEGDDHGPDPRSNALLDLCDPDEMLKVIRATPLANARGLGRVTLRDIDKPAGAPPAADGGKAGAESPPVDAIFARCDLDELKATSAQVTGASADAKAIQAFVGDKLGLDRPLDLSKLTGILDKASRVLNEQLAARIGTPQGPAAGPSTSPGPDLQASTVTVPGRPGVIASREDVTRALDAICGYYERHEPSSPIPLLMNRAKRLVNMSFLDIVRDMAPAGVDQIETLRGKQKQE